jgi:hypothetical protein
MNNTPSLIKRTTPPAEIEERFKEQSGLIYDTAGLETVTLTIPCRTCYKMRSVVLYALRELCINALK